jgi:putative flippase GtrA
MRYVRTHRTSRFARFTGVSLVATVLAQAGLAVGYGVMRWPTLAAVAFAFALSAPPAYLLSRRFVWRDPGRTGPRTGEAVGFLAVALVGSLCSLVSVRLAVWVAGFVTSEHVTLSLVANVASLLATGLVWVARYFVLDRFLFVKHSFVEPVNCAELEHV